MISTKNQLNLIMNSTIKILLLLFVGFIPFTQLQAQDPARFQQEVERLVAKDFKIDENKETVVFTGSSSMRMWTDIQDAFPSVNAINTGFGGSQFSDLIYFRKELIFDYSPDRIFIYEGDNDIAEGKSPSEVLAGAAFLYAKITEQLPDSKIYFISAKPSISRWHLKAEYKQFNELLSEFCEFEESLMFVDVWKPMLNNEGNPKADIFLEDDLHMNSKGYEIWEKTLQPYLQTK